MEISIRDSNDLVLLQSQSEFSKITVSRQVVDSSSFSKIYKLLVEGGELVLEGSDLATEKKTLIFAGFCNLNESDGKVLGYKPSNTTAKELKKVWSEALESKGDLINDNDLLNEDEEYKALAGEEDCMTKAKPCKNCVCGRAEELENNKAPIVSSSCGRCHLGDAFRCAGCPFRGTPAFVPGQTKLQDFEPASIESATKIQGGKVKLDI